MGPPQRHYTMTMTASGKPIIRRHGVLEHHFVVIYAFTQIGGNT
jgi:hypothetical protein